MSFFIYLPFLYTIIHLPTDHIQYVIYYFIICNKYNNIYNKFVMLVLNKDVICMVQAVNLSLRYTVQAAL